jgi:hypothetical protein
VTNSTPSLVEQLHKRPASTCTPCNGPIAHGAGRVHVDIPGTMAPHTMCEECWSVLVAHADVGIRCVDLARRLTADDDPS